MTKEELTAWALANGWQHRAGTLSLGKPNKPTEAIVRLIFKTGVVHLEVKKPAGKWEKLGGAPYKNILPHPDTNLPTNLSLDTIPGFTQLMRANQDQQAMAGLSKP